MKNNAYEKKIYRLLTILNQLANREIVETAGLKELFNITARTVQRDIELLCEIGFPIYSDSGVHKFTDNFSLRKITVTPEEKYLLMLFYRLFSQAEQPFSGIAKNLLDKVVICSKKEDLLADEVSSKYKKKILKEEFTSFSDSLAVRLEDCSYPQSFIEKIDTYLNDVKHKVEALCSKDKVNIKVRLTRKYENNKPAAIIRVPKAYFKDNTAKHDFSTHVKEREFLITTALPGKFRKSFRVSLQLTMYFDFWGTHFKSRDITCFDEFAHYLGFSKDEKLFNYESSYGAHRKGQQLLITKASFSWEKEISMPVSEIKPFLHKKSGIPWSKSWDARKKIWITKR